MCITTYLDRPTYRIFFSAKSQGFFLAFMQKKKKERKKSVCSAVLYCGELHQSQSTQLKCKH